MKTKLPLALLLFSCATAGCECEYVRPGNVGVLVQAMGGTKGSFQQLGVGRYFITPGEFLYIYPTYKQQAIWTANLHEGKPIDESISFQTKENLAVEADVGLTYHFEEDKIIELFRNYQKGADEITHTYLRNHVRDAMSRQAAQLSIEELSQNRGVFMDSVKARVSEQVKSLGIVIEDVYLVNKLRFPKAIADAIDAKTAATQQAQQKENELRSAEADAKKEVAKAEGEAQIIIRKAQAQAEANRLLSSSITPALVEMKKAEAWDGHLSQVSGGNGTFISLTPHELTK